MTGLVEVLGVALDVAPGVAWYGPGVLLRASLSELGRGFVTVDADRRPTELRAAIAAAPAGAALWVRGVHTRRRDLLVRAVIIEAGSLAPIIYERPTAVIPGFWVVDPLDEAGPDPAATVEEIALARPSAATMAARHGEPEVAALRASVVGQITAALASGQRQRKISLDPPGRLITDADAALWASAPSHTPLTPAHRPFLWRASYLVLGFLRATVRAGDPAGWLTLAEIAATLPFELPARRWAGHALAAGPEGPVRDAAADLLDRLYRKALGRCLVRCDHPRARRLIAAWRAVLPGGRVVLEGLRLEALVEDDAALLAAIDDAAGAVQSPAGRAEVARLRGLALLRGGRPVDAAAALAEARALEVAAGNVHDLWPWDAIVTPETEGNVLAARAVVTRVLRVRALLAAGAVDEAVALAEETAFADAPSAAHTARAQALEAAGDLMGAHAGHMRAVWQAAPHAPAEVARAHEALARFLDARGVADEARRHAGLAWAAAELAGDPALRLEVGWTFRPLAEAAAREAVDVQIAGLIEDAPETLRARAPWAAVLGY